MKDGDQTKVQSLFETIPVGLYRTTPEGQILDANLALVETLGFPDRQTLIARNTADGCVDAEERQRWRSIMKREGEVRGFEVQWRCYDGTPIWVRESARAVRDAKGKVVYYEGAVEDITERKRAEEALQKAHAEMERQVEERTTELAQANAALRQKIAERKRAEGHQRLAVQVLELLNQSGEGSDTIRELLFLIKGLTGFEAVGIRLREGDDFPYYEINGFPAEFVEAERYLCARDQAEELIRDSEGNPYLECMCGNVICGRTNPSLPFFTPGGSFWTNSTTELLASTTEEDRQARTRNRCHGEGYESVALIPLRSDSETIGLLQLNDSQKGMFTLETISLFEGIGASIGIALARKRTEEALQRRSRELALLNRVGQELTATLDLQQVTEQLLREVTEAMGAAGGSVWLWDEEREGWLVCRAVFHQGLARSLINLRLRPGQGIAGWVAQKGKSVRVANAPDDPRFSPYVDRQIGFHTTSLLSVPLRARGEVIGVVEAVNKLDGDFSADNLTLVETLAASAAIAIDNARLVEALRRHTVELQARNDELDAFAHTVAHDLKGPLGHMVGFAQVLEQDYAALPDEEVRCCLNTIGQSGHKMCNIIDELLLLARLREIEVEMGPLDMVRIVNEALERLAYMIEKHQAEIVLPQAWPTALGYGPWVEEVWVNYLSNALKYGGRPPRVELGATERETEHEQGNGTIRFWVRDNGLGLTPEEQARLFTPFTRLDQVCAKGHGLGLSIVRRIVEKLGGQVGVESEVGWGSVFSFTLSRQSVH